MDRVVTGYVLKKSFDKMITGQFGAITIYKHYNRSSMVPVKVVLDKEKSDRMKKLAEFIKSPYYDILTDEMREKIEAEIKDQEIKG